MVYVLSKNGQPIMPTKNHSKVRLLLNSGKARVVNRCPFAIQLTGTCKTFTQEVSLGVDAGSKHIGLSATTKKNKLKDLYQNVSLTYGYVTKNTRIKNNLPKEHYVDARCISNNPLAEPLNEVFYYRKVRCHNRQIHKVNFRKRGIRKRNQASYEICGFRLYDKVLWKEQECFISGRTNNRAILRNINWRKVHETPVNLKYLKLVEMRKNYLVFKERCC